MEEKNKATMASFETELLVVLLVKDQIVIGFWQLYVYVYQVNDDNRICVPEKVPNCKTPPEL